MQLNPHPSIRYNTAAIILAQSFHTFQGRGFSSAVHAEQRKNFAFGYMKREPLQHSMIAVAFPKLIYLNGFLQFGPSSNGLTPRFVK